MSNTIKVFIVDDHQMVIEGIKSLLQDENTVEIVGFANTGERCLHFFKKEEADVILMDIGLPDINGIDLCAQVVKKHPHVKIIALSTFSQGTYVRKMIENRAHGYLLKNADKREILLALETVIAGNKYLTPEAQKALRYENDLQKNKPKITKREKEVLALIVEGYTNQQISNKLFISIDTVDSHRKHLYTKLDVNNTAILIQIANQNNLLDKY